MAKIPNKDRLAEILAKLEKEERARAAAIVADVTSRIPKAPDIVALRGESWTAIRPGSAGAGLPGPGGAPPGTIGPTATCAELLARYNAARAEGSLTDAARAAVQGRAQGCEWAVALSSPGPPAPPTPGPPPPVPFPIGSRVVYAGNPATLESYLPNLFYAVIRLDLGWSVTVPVNELAALPPAPGPPPIGGGGGGPAPRPI